jgi:hypothetical protein
MPKNPKLILAIGIILVLLAFLVASCETPPTLTVEPSPTPEGLPDPLVEYGAAATAVDLISAWVDAGAKKSDPFNYEEIDGETNSASFEADILPLFTENGL